MTDPAATQTLTIPVTVRLADLALSAEEIAALTSSGMVDIGPVSEGLSVTVSVGGRTIGGGEIVRLGDRFAVLLDSASDWGRQEAAGEEAKEDGAEDAVAPSAGEEAVAPSAGEEAVPPSPSPVDAG